ncbi:NAD-dependent deacetylase [Rhodococcus rhodochrous]|uniref:NAD-dependent protein deacetylase n=1 Tax=Rhodococcus rhodochrous TaxID=1829 RepID=UPI000750706F|nr:NAD-dependent protein deacetylase [Rhodococcus rhodochrous]MCD2095474.1 NAD-dependent protein deacetylase [Rhodococcus rhodochrous]MCD2120094.1 NAD-dependent protein deacetylase [Rhodococcus rhodochrous]MCQ4134371.1 NAD-dependent protein deacetylase [Rhodococcus rhodochrous]MDJ0016959.1 NAD-dependent protein deacetylase [Rhodococcus rhodochrous]SNV17455.1 NAD-dependent deacetylase [Rhodococcus rhodochrous]
MIDVPLRSDDLPTLLHGRRIAVLTGAGLSTDSGIPDYRGPDSPPRNPMTYQQFVGDAEFRQRYWARNHVGWKHMDAARPNAGHRALAALEHVGSVVGVITQNVDLLHTKAGSRRVVDLHGTYAQVRCLSCEHRISRFTLHERLCAANPGFDDRMRATTGLEVAPDADAVVTDTEDFVVVGCDRCGGMLKPDIVYFGETVPRPRVDLAYSVVDGADALLVAGSSLTVQSGLRFVRRAAQRNIPVVVINRGPTRGDVLATLKLEAGTSETLTFLADAVTAPSR